MLRTFFSRGQSWQRLYGVSEQEMELQTPSIPLKAQKDASCKAFFSHNTKTNIRRLSELHLPQTTSLRQFKMEQRMHRNNESVWPKCTSHVVDERPTPFVHISQFSSLWTSYSLPISFLSSKVVRESFIDYKCAHFQEPYCTRDRTASRDRNRNQLARSFSSFMF